MPFELNIYQLFHLCRRKGVQTLQIWTMWYDATFKGNDQVSSLQVRNKIKLLPGEHLWPDYHAKRLTQWMQTDPE